MHARGSLLIRTIRSRIQATVLHWSRDTGPGAAGQKNRSLLQQAQSRGPRVHAKAESRWRVILNWKFYLVRVAVVWFALGHGEATTAQEATPTPGMVASDQIGCTVEPRPRDDLLALIGTPDPAATLRPGPDHTIVVLPSQGPDHAIVVPPGGPADDATVSAVTATMHEFIACLDADDLLRVFALLTDDYLKRYGPFLADADEPQPLQPGPPIDSGAVVRVRDVIVFPDSRVGAIVWLCHFEDSHAAPGRAYYVVLVRTDNRWQIDDFSPFVEVGGKWMDAADLASDGASTCPAPEDRTIVS